MGGATPAMTFGGTQLKSPSALLSGNGYSLIDATGQMSVLSAVDGRLASRYPVPIPAGLGYDFEGVSFTLVDPSSGPSYCEMSRTGKQIFGDYSGCTVCAATDFLRQQFDRKRFEQWNFAQHRLRDNPEGATVGERGRATGQDFHSSGQLHPIR